MNFTFPDNKAIEGNAIKNFSVNEKGSISYQPIDISKPLENLIQIDGKDYYFKYLGDKPGNKGGHSILLKLYEAQSIDLDDINYDEPNIILKMSRVKRKRFTVDKSEKRFIQEVEALKICKNGNRQNVIQLMHEGICKIKNAFTGRFDEHLFYTMEYAEHDLKSFIESKSADLNIDEKLTFCISLCEGLKELYTLGYYHRDLKPDNIFMIGNMWKIGDLGLVDDRNKPNEIDEIAEPIGPRGWMTPESMNKHYCEGKGFSYKYNCKIDHQSDIFQLGKVFWYIFQHNVPIGSIKESDFLIKDSRIYSILRTMLNHSKKRRYKNIDEVIKLFRIIEVDLFKKIAA